MLEIKLNLEKSINERPGNPEQKWAFGSAPITALEFSGSGDRLAIASKNGYCLILKIHLDEDESNVKGKVLFREYFQKILEIALEREMRSYFGGFLCASWSPSGRFLAAGGEDDLITVMSVETGKIVARCQGHRSWIASIAWDPYVDQSITGNVDSRLGSVGQDGILCLWELATDLMFPRRTR